MTRINTNVSSMVAQNRLRSSNNDLQTSLTRLSTGLRINSASDDSAGIIARDTLRSEITGLTKSISNTQRASQIISTADAALGEVGNLLSEVRGLIVESANSGALSPEELDANQLQIDSSLEAINRISQTTTFQGRKLLDGSQEFTSTLSNIESVTDSNIQQANLGRTSRLDVEVVVKNAAEQAQITIDDAAFTAKDNAFVAGGLFHFASQQIRGEDLWIKGQDYTSIEVIDTPTVSNTGTADYDPDTQVLTITGNFSGTGLAGTVAADATGTTIDAAISAIDGFTVERFGLPSGPSVPTAAEVELEEAQIIAGVIASANIAGEAYNNVMIEFDTGSTPGANYDTNSKTLTVTIDDSSTTTGEQVVTLIENATVDGEAPAEALFSAIESPNIEYNPDRIIVPRSTGLTGGEVLQDDLVFQLSGTNGAETFSFSANTSKDQIAEAVNLVSDTTGITAENTSDGLVFRSIDYGSDAVISLDVIDEGGSGTFESNLQTRRDVGSDVVATVNGIEANASGNKLSINTAALDLSLTVSEGSSTNFNFTITGGGVNFQLGSRVLGAQQANLSLSSVSTGQLGGSAGRLYELGTGQAKSLRNDVNGAAKVIDQVIAQVANERGRLGAFQATTLESNLSALNETKANLQEAESSISDASFADESARLTRAQILVQSGTNVLSLANQNPRNVLQLLQ
ncbi:flagellin N-terminal helical domain-containing protein [Rhodopirellula halodulae]|uniref:flagellin N-terminal helical domain-containing protein n=1 Tax=Rhodopirellula halodulae TaxID=2894198 RepID=UPI001E32A1F6|nr:flagellin [Rhodopirellula sp. JC737]MCC9658764.1 flagellin [Rhodopirellula sp. JC737]